MNCKNCNSPLSEGATFCANCGQKVEENKAPVVETQKEVAEAATVVNQTIPVEKKSSKAPLIILLVVLGVLLIGAIVFAAIMFIPKLTQGNNPNPIPVVTPTKEETIEISGYKFTIPEGFSILEPNNIKVVGTSGYYFEVNKAATSTSTYDVLASTKYYIATQLSKELPSNLSYITSTEEIYDGQKYLIIRFSYDQNGTTYYYDVIYTKLPDETVFCTAVDYELDYKESGYKSMTKFIKSAVSTTVTTTSNDYMVVGNSTLGYLKLPGKWTKGSVSGASETSIQYVNDATVASTAKGSYIVTLNVWKEKPDATTAKYAAEQEANYYRTYDSDATNISVEKVKLGSLDAYKLSTQYKSDSVWVISWYIDGSDGLVHIIQVEGLDLTNDYFKIPETFSFTEIK